MSGRFTALQNQVGELQAKLAEKNKELAAMKAQLKALEEALKVEKGKRTEALATADQLRQQILELQESLELQNQE